MFNHMKPLQKLLASRPTAWLKWPKIDLSTLLGDIWKPFRHVAPGKKKKEFKKEFQYLRPPLDSYYKAGGIYIYIYIE